MLSAKPFFTLRSKRLYDRFVDAPDIHFVKIDPFRWSKLYEKKSLALDSVSQWNCFAIVPQNDCGSSIDFLYISWYCSKLLMYAFLLISSFGANSIVLSFEDILAEAKFFVFSFRNWWSICWNSITTNTIWTSTNHNHNRNHNNDEFLVKNLLTASSFRLVRVFMRQQFCE